MTVTIQLKAIMMEETAVHLMKTQIVGITFAKNVTRKNVRNPANVRRTARILAIYVVMKNLARMKKVLSIVRSKRKRGNVTKTKFGRNARRLVIDVIPLLSILVSIKSFFSK